MRKELNKAVTKTLAAFLNSQGGTLLIGVDDSGAVLGIQADFPYVQKDKPNADGWLLSLKDVVSNALGLEAWGRDQCLARTAGRRADLCLAVPSPTERDLAPRRH